MALKKTARELKNEAHMRTIQKHAKALFGEYGFDRVTVDDICASANVSKSTFYNLYKSKEDLNMISTNIARCEYIRTHYHFDEALSVHELFRRFFQVNYDFVLQHSRSETRMTYRSYLATGDILGDSLERNDYLDALNLLIARATREKAWLITLPENLYWRYVTDTMIGCFIGWSTCIEDQPGLNENYRMLLDALVDSMIKKD